MLKLGNTLIIFSHNLGSFDGYFILPSLFEVAEDPEMDIELLIDPKNKFISIEYTLDKGLKENTSKIS